MVSRLVLGCGSVGYRIAEALADRAGDLTVLCRDESRVEALREEEIDARTADLDDPAAVRGIDVAPDLVFVGTDEPDRNRDLATAARETFPGVVLVAYAGLDADAETVGAIDDVADELVDPSTIVSDRAIEAATSPDATRAQRLRSTLVSADGPLAVVTHDNPDPDAIASAVALVRIAESVGIEAEACYYGEIAHQENRAFVNLLSLELTNLDPDADLDEYGGFALVDHSRPGVNDQLPEDLAIDVVIDHHPSRGPVDATFTDLRSEVGATSTLLAGYLRRFGVGIDEQLATALLYGIRVDTNDFRREVARPDFEAAATLLPAVDTSVLARVEDPSIGAETFEIFARAIRNREVSEDVLATGVGRIGDRDALAQAADRLLGMEGITTTLVYGLVDDTVIVSGRSRGSTLDLGATLRSAFGQIGSAGGHADMAGAQIPLGVIGSLDADHDDEIEAIVEEVISGRFFDELRERPVDIGERTGEVQFPFGDERDEPYPLVGGDVGGDGDSREVDDG